MHANEIYGLMAVSSTSYPACTCPRAGLCHNSLRYVPIGGPLLHALCAVLDDKDHQARKGQREEGPNEAFLLCVPWLEGHVLR